MYWSLPVFFHLKVCPVGNVRDNDSSDFPKLRGVHFSGGKFSIFRVSDKDLLGGLFEEMERVSEFRLVLVLENWVMSKLHGVGGVEGVVHFITDNGEGKGLLRFMEFVV